jgi:hypothetical protein
VSLPTKGGYEGPGIYRHYKGGEYDVLMLALTEDTHETVVVYKPLTPGSFLEGMPEEAWTRDLGVFNEWVEPEDGTGTVPRFEKMMDVEGTLGKVGR